MGLHTYATGYGGVFLFLGTLVSDPAYQDHVIDALQTPNLLAIVRVILPVLAAVMLWLGKGPLSTPAPPVKAQ